MAGGSGDELVDVVDEAGLVVGAATRAAMRAQRLRHRVTFVVVRRPDGAVLVHRRSDDKDVWPGRWDLCAGGVVGAGEGWDEAARRELVEELGIDDVELFLLHEAIYDDDDVAEVARVYAVVWDRPVRFADGEVVEARWVMPAELRDLVDAAARGVGAAFCPDSLALALPHVRGE